MTVVVKATQITTNPGFLVVTQREVAANARMKVSALQGRIGGGGVSGGLARVVSLRCVLAKDAGGLGV